MPGYVYGVRLTKHDWNDNEYTDYKIFTSKRKAEAFANEYCKNPETVIDSFRICDGDFIFENIGDKKLKLVGRKRTIKIYKIMYKNTWDTDWNDYREFIYFKKKKAQKEVEIMQKRAPKTEWKIEEIITDDLHQYGYSNAIIDMY